VAVVFATLATRLIVAINADPQLQQDMTVMNSIRGWDLPGLSGFLSLISAITSLKVGLVYGVIGLGGPFITRQRKTA